MDEQKTQGTSGFVVGVVVGVAATLFLTSKKGRELLSKAGKEGEDILSELEKLLDEGKATVEKAKKHLSPFEKKIEKQVLQKTNSAKEAIEAVVEKMEETPMGEKVTEVVEDLKKLELVETAQEKLAEIKESLISSGESSKKPRRFFKRSTKKSA